MSESRRSRRKVLVCLRGDGGRVQEEIGRLKMECFPFNPLSSPSPSFSFPGNAVDLLSSRHLPKAAYFSSENKIPQFLNQPQNSMTAMGSFLSFRTVTFLLDMSLERPYSSLPLSDSSAISEAQMDKPRQLIKREREKQVSW